MFSMDDMDEDEHAASNNPVYCVSLAETISADCWFLVLRSEQSKPAVTQRRPAKVIAADPCVHQCCIAIAPVFPPLRPRSKLIAFHRSIYYQ